MTSQPPAPPQLSPDGQWWWDGQQWVPAATAPPPPAPYASVASYPSPGRRVGTPAVVALAAGAGALLVGVAVLLLVSSGGGGGDSSNVDTESRGYGYGVQMAIEGYYPAFGLSENGIDPDRWCDNAVAVLNDAGELPASATLEEIGQGCRDGAVCKVDYEEVGMDEFLTTGSAVSSSIDCSEEGMQAQAEFLESARDQARGTSS